MTDHNTITFSLKNQKDDEMKRTLTQVYDALVEKGYDPLNQIVGYLISGDPTYITSYNNARYLIRMLERDELLEELVAFYVNAHDGECNA